MYVIILHLIQRINRAPRPNIIYIPAFRAQNYQLEKEDLLRKQSGFVNATMRLRTMNWQEISNLFTTFFQLRFWIHVGICLFNLCCMINISWIYFPLVKNTLKIVKCPFFVANNHQETNQKIQKENTGPIQFNPHHLIGAVFTLIKL